MLIKQGIQKNAIFAPIGILNKGFKFYPNFCNRRHDSLIMYVNLSDITILSIKCANYCCISSGISKNEAIYLIQNANLTKKGGT